MPRISKPIDDCFHGLINTPKQKPTPPEKLTSPPQVKGKGNGKEFEAHVFTTLLDNAADWGIKEVYRCADARMDGYLVMDNDEKIPLEIKTTLGWASLTNATFQLLAGSTMLDWPQKPKRGLIVFQQWASEWQRRFSKDDDRAAEKWGQFFLEASRVSEQIELGALQLTGDDLPLHSHWPPK